MDTPYTLPPPQRPEGLMMDPPHPPYAGNVVNADQARVHLIQNGANMDANEKEYFTQLAAGLEPRGQRVSNQAISPFGVGNQGTHVLSATDWARISGEDTVLCRFVRDVRLTESGARVVHYAAGLNPVPRRYLEPVMFPYLRLNGVEVEALPPTLSPAARAARLAADDEAAKRAQDLAREAITRAKAAGALPADAPEPPPEPEPVTEPEPVPEATAEANPLDDAPPSDPVAAAASALAPLPPRSRGGSRFAPRTPRQARHPGLRRNVATEVEHGHPPKQAAAIAYREVADAGRGTPLYAGQFAPSEGDLNQRGPVADAAFQVPERITHEQLVEHGNRLWQQRAATRPPDEGGVPPVPVRVIPPARAVTYEPSPDVLKRRG